jgi:hypothetical protein
MPAIWTDPGNSSITFPTGATPTPRSRLLKAMPFRAPRMAVPAEFSHPVPKFRSYFHNDRYGICVSAEEAFSKTCVNPELFDSQAAVDRLDAACFAWASAHRVLNGASLDEVLDWMAERGFQIDAQLFNDGPKLGVDYENEALLKAAIAQGPVKLAIGASALPGGAGSQDGTYALSARNYSSDHSTTLLAYGSVEFCYEKLKLQVPSAIPPHTPGYLHYTWAHIGFVTGAWVKGAADEAWIRQPTTIGIPPLPGPTPPGPGPDPDPLPVDYPNLSIDKPLAPGTYVLLPKFG